MATFTDQIRQGLPRVVGGGPWPATGHAPASAAAPATESSAMQTMTTAAAVVPTDAAAVPAATAALSKGAALRRGLPRVAGGEPWPAAGTALAKAPALAIRPADAVVAVSSAPAMPDVAPHEHHSVDATATTAEATPPTTQAAAPAEAVVPAATEALAATAVHPSHEIPAKAAAVPATIPTTTTHKPRMIGSRTLAPWVRRGMLGIIGVVIAAGIIVLAARGVTTLPGVPEFLEHYPGEYHLPETVENGFPAWARWTHFLNFFLMALIIRSGWQVRTQQNPPAFFTPKRGGKKVSINLWLHTSLDVLWMANGVVFVVLLFASGHWARIVPTSWEVFPNALSAALQYLTLEWPVEDGWVNYNSLQQLMYFTVVFVAAPLSAITGVRMSEWWPKQAKQLNRFYPAAVARAIHFPTMLFFVLFIIVHVFLVFTTGALKNLNHMFAGTPEISWVGFWWFAAGLVITVGVVFAARPLVVAPIASLFGKVSNR